MTRISQYRFWSDSDIADFERGAADLGFILQVVAGLADIPFELGQLALDCNATLVQDEFPTTTGVDGWKDTDSTSIRSDGAKMPYYAPPPVKTVFFKVARRGTRGQPL